MRQLYDTSGQILANTRYDPYGTVLSQDGAATSIYGFTGEQFDASTGLEYLRARFYDPAQGRFVSRDVWGGDYERPLSLNGWNYGNGDPVNLTDRTGLDPNLSGPIALAKCFDLSVGSHGWLPPLYGSLAPVTAQQAVDFCRAAYSKDNWSLTPTANLPTSANELMAWFVNNYRGNSNSDRLYFDATQPLTNELTKSMLIERLRLLYYKEELETAKPLEFQFGVGEFFQSSLFDTPVSGATNLPLTSFMGSFWVQVKTLAVPGGQRIGFRIDNDTTLASGSHFLGRSESGGKYTQNVEDVIRVKKQLAERPLAEVMNSEPVVSILYSRSREQAPGGGGSLYQTFTWTEKRDDCLNWNVKNWTFDVWMLYRHSGYWETRLDMGLWPDYKSVTQDPPGFPPE